MNRLMVWMGFGSLLLLTSSLALSTADAEMPGYVGSSAAPASLADARIRWHDSLDSGWEESRRRNIPMVIYITTERCRYCDAMKRDTWCDYSVLHRVAKDFVAIRLTPQRNTATLNRIRIAAYPTTLIGIPEGKIIGRRVGYQPPAELHGLLSESEGRRTR